MTGIEAFLEGIEQPEKSGVFYPNFLANQSTIE
jgi:hypothetical protein